MHCNLHFYFKEDTVLKANVNMKWNYSSVVRVGVKAKKISHGDSSGTCRVSLRPRVSPFSVRPNHETQ